MTNNFIPGGYILLSRRLIESEIWNMSPLHLKVWLYILMKARHEADEIKGFERGECLISIPELQEVCSYKVGYRTEKPTKHQIDNILRWLRKTSEGTNENDTKAAMITTAKTTRGMIVKVHNYNVYQDPKNYEYDKENDSENVTNTKRIRQQPDTIHKNVKELKNDKNKKEKGEEISLADLEKIADYYQSVIGQLMPTDYNELQQDCNQYGKAIVCKAIEEAARRGAKDFNRPYTYITKCLIDWSKRGLKSKEAVDVYLNGRTSKNNKTATDNSYSGVYKTDAVPLTPQQIYEAWK